MSWLRGRRRTLDIVTEVGEFDNYDRSNTDTLNTGVYSAQYDGGHVVQSEDCCSQLPCDDDNEGLNKQEEGLNKQDKEENNNIVYKGIEINNNDNDVNDADVGDNEDNNDGDKDDDDEHNNADEDDAVFESDDKCENGLPIIGLEQENGDGDSTDMSRLSKTAVSPTDLIQESSCCHSDTPEVNSSTENTEELGNDEVIEQEFKKSGCCKPRFSLDSQMAGLLKSPHVCRISRLSESSITEKEDESIRTLPRPRKSISWAEDLETVHEFEKLKARRLSLANLFKKM